MSVFDNIALSLKIRKVPGDLIKKRVEETAKTLDIYPFLSKKPKALSGGQRQRVALGRAIVREPKVFLLDEPLSNLDAKLRAQMRTEIIKLHRQIKTTFIYVTHDQTEAMTMATKIVVMKDGVIQQIDSPYALYEKPNNLFVAGFIGTPQMNFMEAGVAREQDRYFIEFYDKRFLLPASGKNDVLEKYVGSAVTMGVRPEHIYKDDEKVRPLAAYSFDTTVDVAELMGAETYLYFSLGGNSMIARAPADKNIKIGAAVHLALDINKIFLFDKETRERLDFCTEGC
jgi:multiple sugar transport system ATP-binding protein